MKRIRVAFILLFLLGYFQIASATITFPEWSDTQAKKYQEYLQNENAALSAGDITRVEQRLKPARSNKDWTAIASEYSHLVGKFPKREDYWVQLSLAFQNKNLEENDWNNIHAAQLSAIRAYQIAIEGPDKEKQAIALLAYGNTLSPDSQYESPSYLEILNEIRSLMDLNDLRQRYPDYADLMSFKFLNTRINNQTSSPSACFSFSHPLANKNIQYSDFITVSPKVDIDIQVNGRELCFSPLKYGENYDVTFKAGLPSASGEKTKTDLNTSFKVKDQNSRLSFTNKAYVLMKDEKAVVPLTAVNVDNVGLKVLYISDRGLNQIFANSSDFLRTLWEYKIGEIGNTQGELLWQGEMRFGGEKNKTQTKQIPFSEVVKQPNPGVYLIQAEEKGALYGEKAFATQWLIISDMGFTTLSSEEGGITVSVRSLKTAEPVKDVEVQLLAINNTVLGKTKTTKEGIAVFDNTLTRGQGGNRPRLVLAYGAKGDFSFMDLQQPAFDLSDRGVAGRSLGVLNAFLYTEQGVYRPNDTVHLNALLRDNLGVAKGQLPLTFSLLRPDNVEVGRYTVKGNDLGFYEQTIPISSSARTGQWTVMAFMDPKKPAIGQVHFSVEDFVPSRMLVSLKSDKNLLAPHNPIQVTTTGKYLFGVVANGVEGTATITLREQNDPYPQYSDFSFGLSTESFINTRSNLVFSPLDKNGESTFAVSLDKVPETNQSLEALIEVTLADIGGRPETGSLTVPVRVNPYMIGIKPLFKDRIVAEELNANFEIIVVNTEGKYQVVEGLEYELFQEQLHYTWYQPESDSRWQYKAMVEDKFLNKGVIHSKDNGAVNLEIPLIDWGHYRLVVKDPKTGIQSSFQFSKGWPQKNSDMDSPDRLTLKMDKEDYKEGDTIQLYIEAPFDGEALLTIANNKVLETRNINVSKKGTRVKLKADSTWGTGIYCMVSAFRPLGTNSQDKPFLPKRAIGIAWLGMDKATNTLKVDLTLPAEILPKQTIEVPIQVTREDKESVSRNTQITIAAVDEGILKLTEFKTPDPKGYFFDQRLLGVEIRDLYGKLIEAIPGPLGALKVGGDGGALSRNLQALSKKSFKVVSLYSGLVPLDSNGKGVVKLNIPEFNGSLRLMAVAFDEKRLGSQTSHVLVRDPIVMEAVLPRFLAAGDQSTLSLSIYNVKDEAGEYALTIETEGAASAKEVKALKISLDKGSTHQAIIPIEAQGIGDGKIKLRLTNTANKTAKSSIVSKIDITNVFEISVRPKVAYSSQLFSKLLNPSESDKINLDALKMFVPGTESAAIAWSKQVPWSTSALFKNLSQYPYGCVEQIASKGFGALLDTSKQNSAQNKVGVNQALATLSEKQNPDGSFQLWLDPKAQGNVWLTAYVVDFYQKAKAAGFDVPKFTLQRSIDWLATYVERNNNNDKMNFDGVTYALYVLTKAERVEAGSVRYFYDTYYDKLPSAFSRALIAGTLAEKGDVNRAKAAFMNAYVFKEMSSKTAPFGTALRDQAGVLTLASEALNKIPGLSAPIGSLIESMTQSLATTIIGSNTNRFSTQEQAWLLLAASRLNAVEPSEPIKLLVGNKPLKTDNSVLSLELSSAELQSNIDIVNQGKQKLWQHMVVSGIPLAKPEPIAEGIDIIRRYYDLEGKELDPTLVKQGTQMVVVLEATIKDLAPHQWLLIDFLPAGFEIENARLQAKNNALLTWLGDTTTAQFIEPRDDRFVASVLSDEKTHAIKLAYMVRAVTIGKYVHPGLFVEDMYSPQFYARTEEKTTEVLAPEK